MEVKPLGPVAGAYLMDDSRVACIVGPVGSGKSTGSCLRLARHARDQRPMSDGVARTRWAIVRNTKPQLKDTTIKTWLQVFPEAVYGPFENTAMRHLWKFKPKDRDYVIEAEFMFRALDDAADVANLLSLEVTGFYFNELREIDEEIIVHAGRRAGRFPSVADGGATWAGWFGDTNPWDTEHFLHDRFVEHPRDGWKLFRQPGGMSPGAENVPNLPVGYYEDALKDYNADDAKVYVHAEWGRTRSGKPIYVDYSDQIHCRPFELVKGVPIEVGMDFGRTPAATIGQKLATGARRVRYELCAFDMGVARFGEVLAEFLRDTCRGFEIAHITGDPSGNAKDARDQDVFEILKGAGLKVTPAYTNSLTPRIEAVNKAFRTLNGGEPGLLIHPDCKLLRRACIDGYRFRKLNVMGNRYADEPEKNDYSHVAEALQYQVLGSGGVGELIRGNRNRNRSRPTQADSNWNETRR